MKLIFIYNANSGAVNALFNSAHKLISPSAYNCNLCDITFGVFSERAAWKHFRESSGINMVFLHKDEFLKQYKSKWLPKYEFPIILSEEKERLDIVISTEELNALKSVNDLIEEIQKRAS